MKLDKQLAKDDKAPGSGTLTSRFSAGAAFPLKDAVRLMTVQERRL